MQDGRGAQLAIRLPSDFTHSPELHGRAADAAHFIASAFIERHVGDETIARDVFIKCLRLGRCEPLAELTARLLLALLAGLVCLYNLLRQGSPTRAVRHAGNHQARRAVLDVAVLRGLRGVAEEGGHGVVVTLRPGIELVVVALAAVRGEAHVNPAHRLHAVRRHVHQVLLVDGAAFVCGDVATLEAGGDELRFGWVRQEITGDLFNGELVEGLVVVERTDDPVAIRPHLAVVVEVEAVGVAVAGGIEPVAPTMLAPFLRLHELIHELLIGIGRLVFHERFHSFWSRRKAGQIKREPANERATVRFCSRRESALFQLCQDETVHGILHPRLVFHSGQRCAFGCHEGPVRLPVRAFLDPFLDDRDLLGFEVLVLLARRHDVVFIGGDETLIERALVRLALDDGRAFLLSILHASGEKTGFCVQAQTGLSRSRIWSVAMEADIRKNGPHIAVEHDCLRCRVEAGKLSEQGQSDQTGDRMSKWLHDRNKGGNGEDTRPCCRDFNMNARSSYFSPRRFCVGISNKIDTADDQKDRIMR